MDKPKILRWLLDVNLLWSTKFEPTTLQTSQWATGEAAKRALELLPPDEQAKVVRFHRPSDAKLCLASFLLKHRAIMDICHVPWAKAIISEDSNRKPCYKQVEPAGMSVEFNVSHHGDLVALVGCVGNSTKLGVDIVRMNWKKDYASVMKDGFQAWAHVYEMVFSDREINDIANYAPSIQLEPQEAIRAKLRHFYAHWCLKEAYVKMTGEALLAPWLKELEFRNVQVPLPTTHMGHNLTDLSDWGEACTDIEIWFRGEPVKDVKLEIQAFEEDYMIATAVLSLDIPLSAFQEVDIERDIYP